MRRCGSCGRAVSDDIDKCPNCGRAIDVAGPREEVGGLVGMPEAPAGMPSAQVDMPSAQVDMPSAQVGTPSATNAGPTVLHTPQPGAARPAVSGTTMPTSGKATVALVFGILGIVFAWCCLPLGLVAVIVGPQARREIAASNGALGGNGQAQAGIIMGWISLALVALWIGLIVLGAALDSA